MRILTALKKVTSNTADQAKERAAAVNRARQRRQLQRELGELTHKKHRGDAVVGTSIAAVLARLDDLDEVPSEAEQQGDDDRDDA